MPDLLFHASVVWVVVLVGGAVGVLVRASSPFVRILAADTMVLLVVAFLLVLAIGTERGVYVDAALALALLGFATTVALVRVEGEERER